MIDYIRLEDQIISMLETIEYSDNSEFTARYDSLTEQFKKYWTTFQDSWGDDLWMVYNDIRNNGEVTEKKVTTNDSSIQEDFEKLRESRVSTHNNDEPNDDDVFMNSLHLKKIDDEIEGIQDGQLVKDKKEEKKRGCGDCILF
jgi:hypothetical protein